MIIALTLIASQSAFSANIKGMRAEALFEQISQMSTDVADLNAVDCAMGTCVATLKNVTCTKEFVDTDTRTGYLINCTMPSLEGKMLKITKEESSAIAGFRRSLIEITGKLVTGNDSNTVKVKSIECKGSGLARDVDSLEREENFTCTVK